ncbi:RidA family protein [Streptomyces sp. NPDC002838]|uniref:RidA family protein n=1 Tax=Streptomyces sp. NPDC002838 TaxID=3154436 RepID=UPI003324F078
MSNIAQSVVPSGHSKPIGRYSPGLSCRMTGSSRMVFVSGQVATDAQGTVLSPGDAGGQAEAVFDNIRTVLQAADASLSDLVSVQIFLADVVRDFPAVSAVRNRVLGEPAPASVLVEVSRLAEDGCLVEISGVAIVDDRPGAAR